jgi:hypothetical protein
MLASEWSRSLYVYMDLLHACFPSISTNIKRHRVSDPEDPERPDI